MDKLKISVFQKDFDNDKEKNRQMYPKILRWMAKLDLHSWQMGYQSALDRVSKIQDDVSVAVSEQGEKR